MHTVARWLSFYDQYLLEIRRTRPPWQTPRWICYCDDVKYGIGVGVQCLNNFLIQAIPLILLMTWAFLPLYLGCGVYTLPEYLSKRFEGGHKLRMLVSLVFILTTLNCIMPVSIYFILPVIANKNLRRNKELTEIL